MAAVAHARRGYAVLFRALAYGQAALAVLQAAFAGHMLTGHPDARAWHHLVGSDFMPVAAAVQLLAAVLLWRPGGGPAWPIPAVLALGAVLQAQIGWGFDARLALHIPIGVGLVAGQMLLARAPLRPLRLPLMKRLSRRTGLTP